MLPIAAAIRLPGMRPGRMMEFSLAESLPRAKRCSDAALRTSNDARSGGILQVLGE